MSSTLKFQKNAWCVSQVDFSHTKDIEIQSEPVNQKILVFLINRKFHIVAFLWNWHVWSKPTFHLVCPHMCRPLKMPGIPPSIFDCVHIILVAVSTVGCLQSYGLQKYFSNSYLIVFIRAVFTQMKIYSLDLSNHMHINSYILCNPSWTNTVMD